jgi:hypothetical protein
MRIGKTTFLHFTIFLFAQQTVFSSGVVSMEASIDRHILLPRSFFSIAITLSNNSSDPIYIIKDEFYVGDASFHELESGERAKHKIFGINDQGLTTFLARDDIMEVDPGEKLTKRITGRVMYDQYLDTCWLSFFSYDVLVAKGGIYMIRKYSVGERLIRQAKEMYDVNLYEGELASTNLIFISYGNYISATEKGSEHQLE